MQRWANDAHKGEIKDAVDVDAVYTFLRAHASPAPEAKRDESGEATTLSARTPVFVQKIELAHH